MDEARRFLRYVVPGLVFGAQTLVLLFVLDATWTWYTLQRLTGDSGLGVAATLLLASGGLGFVFGAIHHLLHWIPRITAVDHRALISSLRKDGLIRVVDQTNDPAQASLIRPIEKPVDRSDAWVIVTSLWYQRTRTNERIGAADSRTVALTDAMHSLGTARVSSIAAWIAAIWISPHSVGVEWRGAVAATLLALLLLIMFHSSYKRTGSLAQRLTASVLTDALNAIDQAKASESIPVTVHLEVAAAESKAPPPTTELEMAGRAALP